MFALATRLIFGGAVLTVPDQDGAYTGSYAAQAGRWRKMLREMADCLPPCVIEAEPALGGDECQRVSHLQVGNGAMHLAGWVLPPGETEVDVA